MKILIAGQAVFTINLAQGLAAAGHSVTVLTPSENWYRQVRLADQVVHRLQPTLQG